MNSALWKKTWTEGRLLLLGCASLMFAFHWLRIWLISQLPIGNLKMILNLLPPLAEQLSAVPLSQVATSTGRIAVAYDDPLVMLVALVWALARGSDAVSGELGRGTMEMLLAQPVSRVAVLWTQSAMTLLGAVLISVAGWLGTCVGLSLHRLEEPVDPMVFLPAAGNVIALIIFLAGLSTLVSSFDSYRWRTIGVVGTFYVVEAVLMIMARSLRWDWLGYVTFLTAFAPEVVVGWPEAAWSFAWQDTHGAWRAGALGYDTILLGLGMLMYGAATWVFVRRDLPAPL